MVDGRLCTVQRCYGASPIRVFHDGYSHELKDLHRFSLKHYLWLYRRRSGRKLCLGRCKVTKSINHAHSRIWDNCSNYGSSIHSHCSDLVPRCRHQFSQSSAVLFESEVDRCVEQKFDGQFDSNLGRWFNVLLISVVHISHISMSRSIFSANFHFC